MYNYSTANNKQCAAPEQAMCRELRYYLPDINKQCARALSPMCRTYRSCALEIENWATGYIDPAAQLCIFCKRNVNILHLYAVIRLESLLFYTSRRERLSVYNPFRWLFAVIFPISQSLRFLAKTNLSFTRWISIPPPRSLLQKLQWYRYKQTGNHSILPGSFSILIIGSTEC